MYVLPYILSEPGKKYKQVWLFLERNGTHMMELESSQVPAFLEENELNALSQRQSGGILYIQINPKAEGLSNFYTWGEVQPGTIPAKEVWRPFLWMDETEHLWGVNKQLEGISLSSSHTVASVIETLCSV